MTTWKNYNPTNTKKFILNTYKELMHTRINYIENAKTDDIYNIDNLLEMFEHALKTLENASSDDFEKDPFANIDIAAWYTHPLCEIYLNQPDFSDSLKIESAIDLALYDEIKHYITIEKAHKEQVLAIKAYYQKIKTTYTIHKKYADIYIKHHFDNIKSKIDIANHQVSYVNKCKNSHQIYNLRLAESTWLTFMKENMTYTDDIIEKNITAYIQKEYYQTTLTNQLINYINFNTNIEHVTQQFIQYIKDITPKNIDDTTLFENALATIQIDLAPIIKLNITTKTI